MKGTILSLSLSTPYAFSEIKKLSEEFDLSKENLSKVVFVSMDCNVRLSDIAALLRMKIHKPIDATLFEPGGVFLKAKNTGHICEDNEKIIR